MIETGMIGEAVGVQRNPLQDKTETTTLPSATNAVVVGDFKRGFINRPFVVTPDNFRAILGHDPSNPDYNIVEDAMAQNIRQLTIVRTGSSLGK